MLTSRAKIDVIVEAGTLVEWLPRDTRQPIRCVVLLSRQAFDWLAIPKGGEVDDIEIVRVQSIEQIEAFMRGDLTVRQCMKDLSSRNGVCEWKRPTRAPGMRIIGTLLSSDVFFWFPSLRAQ